MSIQVIKTSVVIDRTGVKKDRVVIDFSDESRVDMRSEQYDALMRRIMEEISA